MDVLMVVILNSRILQRLEHQSYTQRFIGLKNILVKHIIFSGKICLSLSKQSKINMEIQQ
jgi:hypothetical protein